MLHTIQQSNQPSLSTISVGREEDVFESVMTVLESIQQESYQITKENISTMYNGLKYGSESILLEGVQDLKESAKKFFKRVIQKIKELFSHVMMIFNRQIMTVEGFIKKYEKEISQANPNFSVRTFDYTFTKDLPNVSVVDDLVRDYNGEVHELQYRKKADLVEENMEKIQRGYFDTLRGKMLGLSTPVEKEDLYEVTDKLLRNNTIESYEKPVDKTTYQEFVKGFGELKKVSGDLKKERDRVLRVLSALDRFFSTGAITMYGEHEKRLSARHITISADSPNIERDPESELFDITDIGKVSTFFTHKWNECQEITNALTTILNCKLDAVNEALSIYKKVIFRGLQSSNQQKDVI